MKKKKNEEFNEEVKEELNEEVKEEIIDENIDLGFQEEIEKLKKEVEEWKLKAYTLAADTDNLRKSYERDHANLLKYRAMGFVERLLPVLDSFHMVLMSKPSDPAVLNYIKGFEMIYRQMLNALEQEGVSEISPEVGQDFNADNMQAVDVASGEEDNKVVQVYSKGYILKDRLVRPAMVVVSKVETSDEKENAEEAVIN